MHITSTVSNITTTESKPRRVTDVPTALELLISALTYCNEAGLTVQFVNDARDNQIPKLVLVIPNCLVFKNAQGKHEFKYVEPLKVMLHADTTPAPASVNAPKV